MNGEKNRNSNNSEAIIVAHHFLHFMRSMFVLLLVEKWPPSASSLAFSLIVTDD